jgi:hypothetical protein
MPSIWRDVMKAIRSKRLAEVLKDPRAARQLRVFLASASLNEPSTVEISVNDPNGTARRYTPKLVPVGRPGA